MQSTAVCSEPALQTISKTRQCGVQQQHRQQHCRVYDVSSALLWRLGQSGSHLDSNFLHYSTAVVALLRPILKPVDQGSSTEHRLQPTGYSQHIHAVLSTA